MRCMNRISLIWKSPNRRARAEGSPSANKGRQAPNDLLSLINTPIYGGAAAGRDQWKPFKTVSLTPTSYHTPMNGGANETTSAFGSGHWRRTFQLVLFAALACACTALPPRADAGTSAPAPGFPHVVQYELGDSEFAPGDSIKIEGLRGTSATIESGGTYCVTGTYVLTSQDEADLSFFATTTNRIAARVEPEQTVHLTKGTGSFRLVKRMTDPGYLHLTFYSRPTGKGFGGVYFGQGQWVLHNKPFSYSDPVAEANVEAAPPAFAGPNEALFNYLGNPVPPPPNMDSAYTKAGLTGAIQAAAQKAGISLVRVEIDDSEFPFLVGVVLTKPGERQKLEEQIKKLDAYTFSGGVSGDTICAMNIVPHRAYPPESSQRIHHRMMLREAVLYDRISRMR